jgi:phosphoribosylamine--glycine ligase
MGAYSPAPVLTPEIDAAMDAHHQAHGRGMKATRHAVIRACCIAGADDHERARSCSNTMCRFGDPECQVLMLRLMSDLLPALLAARDGQLKNFDLRWYPDAALTVVMAAKGYPGDYEN